MSTSFMHALIFAVVGCACVFATTRWRTEPAIAVILAAAAFGVAAGLSTPQLGKSFGTGFGAGAASTGLTVLAAALLGGIGASSTPRLPLAAIGLFAGMGASPAAGFAVLMPICRGTGALRLGLALSAGQGLLLPSPVTIAATTILGADWRLVLCIGLPCALLVTIATDAALRSHPVQQPAHRADTALIVACLALASLLIVQSVGDVPSEPFGGGSAREFLLGAGRPFILLLACAGIMLAATRNLPLRTLSMEGTAGRAVSQAAPVILLIGAAGGLQSLAQDTHMADTLAETVSTWHGGLLVPFLVACCLKALQGSSLVASIAAAGLMLPVLGNLGLDHPTGRACAALAVGCGAMAGSTINDAFFWLVARQAELHPAQACVWVSFGTLAQGMGSLGLLAIVLYS